MCRVIFPDPYVCFIFVTHNLIHSTKVYNMSIHFDVFVNEISKIQDS